MLLELKVFFIGFIYLLGALFMVIFPPTNFKLNGGAGKSTSAKKIDCKSMHNSNLPACKYIGMYTYSEKKHNAKNYLTSQEVNNLIEDMVKQQPDFVTAVSLVPNTFKNNTIKVVEVKSDPGVKKKGILVIGALDPMVWAAANGVLELTFKIANDPQFRTPYLTDYNWYMIPAANPDGLDYTLSVRELPVLPDAVWHRNMTEAAWRPPLWQKNLEGSTEGCFGTNLDRNFAYHWQDDATTSTRQACSQSYDGDKPFSAAEACALRHYIDGLSGSIDIAVHLSAVYQRGKESIVYPWRYAVRRPDNWRVLQSVGEAGARAAAETRHAPHFEVYQSSADGASGGSLEDYLKGVVGTELVYVVRPYHIPISNTTPCMFHEDYVQQATAITLGLVSAHRNTNKRHTLSFFGQEKQF